MLVLFGSETGNAQDVAERIVRQARRQGWEACALPLDAVPLETLAQEPLAVFVCSTTGALLLAACRCSVCLVTVTVLQLIVAVEALGGKHVARQHRH